MNPWHAEQLEQRPIGELLPYARNARTHSEAQVAQIAASIAEFGFVNPILVGADNTLIAGHGRLLAARKLGLETVPVLVLEHLSETQRRALIIADNKLAENAGWDDELLALELAELQDSDFDLDLLGLDDAEISEMLSGLDDDSEEQGEGSSSTDASDPPEEADADLQPQGPVITRLGDLWQLGEHRLICGSSSDPATVAALMDGEQAKLLFTSPPYANQRHYTTGGIDDWDTLMQGVFGAASPAMAEDGQVLVNLGLVHREGEWRPYWDDWIKWMRAQRWRPFGWYVWDQGVTVPGDWAGRLAPRHEFIFHFNRQARKPNKLIACKTAGQKHHLRADGSGDGLRNADGRNPAWTHFDRATQDRRIPDSVITVMRQRGSIGEGIDHPAVFPIGLPRFVMEAFTDPGEQVLEPFSGSGTSILAAEQCGRQARAIEVAPEYVDVALKRWQQHHPEREPVLMATGQRWSEVVAERTPEATGAA